MSLRRLPALPSASAVPSVHVESAVTVASAVPSVHVESLVDIESETLVDTGEAPAALATPARGDVTGESSNEACAGVNRDEREATGSAESKDGAGSGGARVTPASEQATTTAAAAAVVAVHGGVVAPRISTVSPRATHAQALIFGDSPVSASAYCGGTAIVWLGGTLVVALWLCIPVYDARASSLSGSALVNASSAAGVGPAGMDFTWFASAFHPLYFLSAIAVGFGLWGQALPLPSAPAIAGVCIVTCGMDAGLLFMLKAYYFESRVLTFGSTTLVIALAFFAFMAWYVTRHHERVTQFRLESLRKWSPRARRSRVLPARAPPSATALGGDEKIALIGGPDGLLPRELTDGAVAAAPRSHGAHSVDDQASAPAAIQSLSLENFVSKEAPRVPRLSIAAVQRHNLPVPSSVLQKQVEANLRVTGGVIVISALILVSYSYCQGFTWAYVKYASGNDSLQVLMSTIFQVCAPPPPHPPRHAPRALCCDTLTQWPLFIVGNLLTRVAESVDERVRGSRALEPAMTFLNALFTEIFAKNLFTSVTTYETFAAFEVLAIAQLILQARKCARSSDGSGLCTHVNARTVSFANVSVLRAIAKQGGEEGGQVSGTQGCISNAGRGRAGGWLWICTCLNCADGECRRASLCTARSWRWSFSSPRSLSVCPCLRSL